MDLNKKETEGQKSTSSSNSRRYITFEETLDYLGVKKSKLYNLSGEVLPYYKAAGKRWYDPQELDAYIASGRVGTYRETGPRRGQGRTSKGRSKRK